jgi:hypothetical protein
MVIDFAQRIIARLPADIKAFALKLQETESSLLNGMPAIICNSKFIL